MLTNHHFIINEKQAFFDCVHDIAHISLRFINRHVIVIHLSDGVMDKKDDIGYQGKKTAIGQIARIICGTVGVIEISVIANIHQRPNFGLVMISKLSQFNFAFFILLRDLRDSLAIVLPNNGKFIHRRFLLWIAGQLCHITV